MHIRPIQLIRLCIAALLCVSSAAFALAPGARVDNFRLLDQNGASHELYYHSDAKAVVIMVQGNGCPIVRKAWPQFKALREHYRAQGVESQSPLLGRPSGEAGRQGGRAIEALTNTA